MRELIDPHYINHFIKEFKTRPSQKLYFMRTINGTTIERSLVRIKRKSSLKSSLKHNILLVDDVSRTMEMLAILTKGKQNEEASSP